MKSSIRRTKTLHPVLFGAGLALTTLTPANAALLVHYTFDNLALGAIGGDVPVANSGTLGGAGTLSRGTGAGSATVVASGAPGGGRAVQFTPGADGDQNAVAPHINTTSTLSSLGITPSMAYTMMAWANFTNSSATAGDNMIFGQNGASALPGGESLHHGTRNGNLHSGHWGDDLGPDQGVSIPTGSGWHHVAFTNDGAAGNQSIYLDGNLVAGPAAAGVAGAFDVNQNLWIATSNNGGSFNGALDEVKVFNSQLSQAEIRAALVVPEPGGMAFLALSLVGLMSRRRR